MNKAISIAGCICFYFSSLFSEIQTVSVTWDHRLCEKGCVDLLNRRFSRIEGAASFTINQEGGRVLFRWKPNAPFEVKPINIATRLVGIRLHEIEIKVKGIVQSKDDDFYLVSLGDNTSFQLIGKTEKIPGLYVTKHNLKTHPIPEDQLKKLKEYEKKHFVVTVSGPLFRPIASRKLYLIIHSIQIEKDEKNSSS